MVAHRRGQYADERVPVLQQYLFTEVREGCTWPTGSGLPILALSKRCNILQPLTFFEGNDMGICLY